MALSSKLLSRIPNEFRGQLSGVWYVCIVGFASCFSGEGSLPVQGSSEGVGVLSLSPGVSLLLYMDVTSRLTMASWITCLCSSAASPAMRYLLMPMYQAKAIKAKLKELLKAGHNRLMRQQCTVVTRACS